MIDIKQSLDEIEHLSEFSLLVAVCVAAGWQYDPEKRLWLDPESHQWVTFGELPPFTTDLNQAFRLMQTHGLALIPQSVPDEPNHLYRWLCTDIICVTYADRVEIEEKESTAFGSMSPCEAICKSFLAVEMMADYEAEKKEEESKKGESHE